MAEQERKLGDQGFTRHNGLICTSLPPELADLYQKAAEETNVTIAIRNVGMGKENKPLCMIDFPNGGLNQVLDKVYELSGGIDEFYKKFGPEAEKSKEAPELLPPCSTKKQ